MAERLLVIVPCYNEAESVERVVDALIRRGYDYVVVNDGSGDATAEICRRRGFKLLDLPVNLGLAGAFQAGMMYARAGGYDYALQFDGDGQHDPEYIAPMLEKAREGDCDIVVAARDFRENRTTPLRRLGGWLLSGAIRLTTGRALSDPTCGMRLYNRVMIEILAANINFGPEPDTIAHLMRSGARVAEVRARVSERESGKSYLSSFNAVKYMLRMALSILLVLFVRRRVNVRGGDEKGVSV